ncbi:hypothetical protein RJT34_10833 [Clitoria ternatea]|uniref:Uncharacterized protein n=1 Tax=Clitoria ternatea TaxID=43366 RepID=A0AAN9PJY4_CLITE
MHKMRGNRIKAYSLHGRFHYCICILSFIFMLRWQPKLMTFYLALCSLPHQLLADFTVAYIANAAAEDGNIERILI